MEQDDIQLAREHIEAMRSDIDYIRAKLDVLAQENLVLCPLDLRPPGSVTEFRRSLCNCILRLNQISKRIAIAQKRMMLVQRCTPNPRQSDGK